jgi:hypothetical protein
MATDTRFHHRPPPRTAYLLGRPAAQWIDAISGPRRNGLGIPKADRRHGR